MKILIVITSMQTGGAEKMVIDFVPRLRALGHQIGVAVMSGDETPFLQILKKQDCQLYVFGRSVYNPLCIIDLMKIMRRYDIVHTHLTYPQYYAAIANLFVKTALVTTEHSTNNRRRGNWMFSVIDRWMYSRYKAVVCISHKAEETLRSFIRDFHTTKICTIDNGVDVEAFHNVALDTSLREDSRRFIAVMVASFHWQKDQDTIIRAMALLPKEKFELWLVGVGNRKPILEKLVSDLGIEDQVRFWGGRTDIAAILHAADVAIMSSHFEGLSLSSLEGMSVGHPFIASDVDGLHDVVEGAGILFPHEDEKALSRIIQRLEVDRDYYDNIAEQCYNRAKEYDIKKTINAYHLIYNRVVR